MNEKMQQLLDLRERLKDQESDLNWEIKETQKKIEQLSQKILSIEIDESDEREKNVGRI